MNFKPRARTVIIAALISIYLIWGTTYLAVRVAIESLPPFLMIGFRYLTAGIFLFLFARISDVSNPTWTDWKQASYIGISVMGICNGIVVLVSPFLNSGTIACLFGISPFVLSLAGWMLKVDRKPEPIAIAYMLLGFTGVALLSLSIDKDLSSTHWIGIPLILVATISWAIGTAYSSRIAPRVSIVMLTSLQMIWGSAFNLVIGLSKGELDSLNFESITIPSILSFVYLVVFGTIIAFLAYNYLLRTTSLSLVGTHAYVNPLVALVAGYLVLGEQLTPTQACGALIIILAVYGSLLKHQCLPFSKMLKNQWITGFRVFHSMKARPKFTPIFPRRNQA